MRYRFAVRSIFNSHPGVLCLQVLTLRSPAWQSAGSTSSSHRPPHHSSPSLLHVSSPSLRRAARSRAIASPIARGRRPRGFLDGRPRLQHPSVFPARARCGCVRDSAVQGRFCVGSTDRSGGLGAGLCTQRSDMPRARRWRRNLRPTRARSCSRQDARRRSRMCTGRVCGWLHVAVELRRLQRIASWPRRADHRSCQLSLVF